MSPDQLKEVLDKHSKWWMDEEGGERANLRRANLSGANLSGADLRRANLSDAKGFFDSIKYLMENFERTEEGFFAYKTFGENYSPNPAWKIEQGSIIEEVVNPCPTFDCGCGVNVAKLSWVKDHTKQGDIWKCLIRFEWLIGAVIPYDTDGKFRTARAQLIEIVPR